VTATGREPYATADAKFRKTAQSVTVRDMSGTVATDLSSRVRDAIADQRDRLLALVRRHAGPTVDADEVVQAAAERALARSEQLRDADRVEAWIARIARNAAIDELRRRNSAFIPLHDIELPAHEDHDVDCGCVLVQAAALKPEYALILKRVDIDGAAVTEIARELGLTANNAMVRLHRARKALRVAMVAHCGTASVQSCAQCGCRERGCCAQRP